MISKFYKPSTNLRNLTNFTPNTLEKNGLIEKIKSKKNLKTNSMVKMKSLKPMKLFFKT